MGTPVFTGRARLEGRRHKSTSIELCTSMVAKLECHLLTRTAQLQTPNRGALSLGHRVAVVATNGHYNYATVPRKAKRLLVHRHR